MIRNVLLLIYLLFFSYYAHASILINAQKIKFNKNSNQITAIGDINAKYENKELEADYLLYNKDEKEIEATGNIDLHEPGLYKILADKIWSREDFSLYEGENIYAMLDGLNHIQSRNIKYDFSDGYRFSDAKFTACPICDNTGTKQPLWSFSSKKVFFDINSQNVYYQHAFFNIKDVPIMYFPFFSHPSPFVKKRTGFLPPSFESTSNLGNMVSTPFFINIDDNIDATYTPTILKDKNFHHHLETRAITDNSTLNLEAGYIRENERLQDSLSSRNLTIDGKDNWVVNGTLRIKDLHGFQAQYNIKRTSSEAYLQRYITDLSVYENSDFLIYKDLDNGSFFAEIDYGNDVRSSNLTYYRLPHINYSTNKKYKNIDTNFKLDTDYLIQNGDDKRQRISLSETLSHELPYKKYGNFRASAVFRGDSYNPLGSSNSDQNELRLASSYYLNYDNSFYRKSILGNEIIKPEVKLSIMPKSVDKSSISTYDSVSPSLSYTNIYRNNLHSGYDYIDQDSRLSYGLNYLVNNDSYQITSFLGQLYRFSTEDVYTVDTGLSSNSSDFVSTIDLTISDNLHIMYNSRLAHYDLSPYINEITAKLKYDNINVSANYTNYNLRHISENLDDTEFFNADIKYKINKHVKANAQALFDFENEDVHRSGMQRIHLGLLANTTCVDYSFAVSKVYINNEYVDPDLTFTFNIILKGIADSLF